MIILIELEGSIPSSPGSTPGELLTAVWVRRPRLTSLGPMGMLTHPRQAGRSLRHGRDVEKWEVPVKVGELTEPMVDVISKVTADCLDPGGNIDKESRPVSSIR